MAQARIHSLYSADGGNMYVYNVVAHLGLVEHFFPPSPVCGCRPHRGKYFKSNWIATSTKLERWQSPFDVYSPNRILISPVCLLGTSVIVWLY